jgi:5-methylcytosine-specific restriction endonuclease McrBC GTP-binding regulatory subunit McrB
MNNLVEELKKVAGSTNSEVVEAVKEEEMFETTQVNFFKNAIIDLYVNGKLSSNYPEALEELKNALQKEKYLNMGYTYKDRSYAIYIQLEEYVFYCSIQQTDFLRVFRIEKGREYGNFEVENVFHITDSFSDNKPNSHLQFLYFSLNTDKGELSGKPLSDVKKESIPVIFNKEEIREEDIFYVSEYFQHCPYVEVAQGRDNISLYLRGYKIKALLSRNVNHLYVFNIVFERNEKKDFYLETSAFKLDVTQEEIDNKKTNVEVNNFWKKVNPNFNYCFQDIPDRKIELNFQAPKHNVAYNEDISNIKNEIVEMYYREKKAIIYTNTLKIEAIIHRTNFDVNQDLIRHGGNREYFHDFERCFVNGAVFEITQGDIKQNRRENQHLINFLKNGNKKDVSNNEAQKEEKPTLEPLQTDGQKTTYNFKNIILSGVAGVGKTHSYKKLISLIEQGVEENKLFHEFKDSDEVDSSSFKERIEFITFHQSYSYEEFIEGFRPSEHSGITIEAGVFKEFVNKAKTNCNQNYYFVIDEINRGNISKIFGELITLIEDSKRNVLSAKLPYSKEELTIPKNLFIIGTMNITDQSISKIDIALRRRFIFVNVSPNPDLVCPQFKAKFIELNRFISDNLGDDYLIGHSYFMKCNDENLDFILNHQVIPLLEDYFYGDKENLEAINSILN